MVASRDLVEVLSLLAVKGSQSHISQTFLFYFTRWFFKTLLMRNYIFHRENVHQHNILKDKWIDLMSLRWNNDLMLLNMTSKPERPHVFGTCCTYVSLLTQLFSLFITFFFSSNYLMSLTNASFPPTFQCPLTFLLLTHSCSSFLNSPFANFN